MKGSVYRACWCRDPETKKPYHSRCPKLRSPKHGKWYARYDSSSETRRQPVLGPFGKKTEAEEALAAAVAREGGGAAAHDRSLRIGPYLDSYLAGKRNLKDSTRETDAEAFRLYWRPALGRMRLVDVRDRHVADVITEMLRINQPPEDGDGQPSEMLRRMIAARADDARRELAEGETRHKKSAKPLSPARVERMFAPFRAAMNAAVKTGKIGVSPCLGVELPRADKVKPLAWTLARERKFRVELAKRVRAAEAAKPGAYVLTTVERQELWDAPDLRPCPVMVWLPAHIGAFLDYLDETGERLAALFVLVAFCGLRRDEALGLTWAEVDLDQGVLYVRETASGSGPKTDAGVRVVTMAALVTEVLKAWRKVQVADRLAWGEGWAESDLVFTRPDGSAVPAQWTSVRFELLAYRAGLPPIRFHDLRHGAASLQKAAGTDTKVISAMLGHSRTSFTDSVYVTLFPEIQKAAAEAAVAVVPRRLGTRATGGA